MDERIPRPCPSIRGIACECVAPTHPKLPTPVLSRSTTACQMSGEISNSKLMARLVVEPQPALLRRRTDIGYRLELRSRETKVGDSRRLPATADLPERQFLLSSAVTCCAFLTITGIGRTQLGHQGVQRQPRGIFLIDPSEASSAMPAGTLLLHRLRSLLHSPLPSG